MNDLTELQTDQSDENYCGRGKKMVGLVKVKQSLKNNLIQSESQC